MENGNKKRDDPLPWLLITDGEHNEKQHMYSMSENRFHPHHDPELDDTIVLGSAHGWLVLSYPETGDISLWNPISMDKIQLGMLELSLAYDKCVMSKPPTEPDCDLVFFSTSGNWQSYWRLLGDRTVATLTNPEGFPTPVNRDKLLAAAAFRGTIYGFLHPGFRFVIVHFGDEGKVEFRPVFDQQQQRPWDMPDSSWDSESFWEYNMIEAAQELLLVKTMRVSKFVDPEELDFRVFRVDVDRKECVELDDLGDHRAIFISSQAGGFCCSGGGGGLFRGNCIYYTLRQGKSRCVFAYDLNDRSTSPLLPCPGASRTHSRCYWLQNQVFASSSTN